MPLDPRPLTLLYRGVIVTAILAALLVAATIWLQARKESEDEWVRHTLAVRAQIAEVVIFVQRLESSQRGYLLTGRDLYLAPFEEAASVLPVALDNLEKLVADNPPQQQAVGQLRRLATDKVNELRETIGMRKAGHADEALAIVNKDTGLRLMNDIRSLATTMQAEEDRLLRTRQATSANFGLLVEVAAGLGFLLICAIGILVSVLIGRAFVEVSTARDQLLVKHQQLVEEVSQREKAESQLRQSQKMQAIGQLTGGIAHDFNNMLGVITGSLELIQRRIKAGDFGIERFLDSSLKAASRAAGLTHRLLAFARQQPLAPEVLNANRMIATMSDLLRSTLGEQIVIETVSAAGLWTTKADAHQLESALLNIAINARDAMPGGGKLTIETANAYLDDAYARQHAEVEPGQFVMIAVTDTGAGMTPEVASRVFDPFFTTKPVGQGTGLGLSQVYGFVKQSRGHIKIYSEPGSGSTVKIYLPRFIADAAASVQAPTPEPVAPAKRGEVILLVEDDVLMLRLTAESLRELGYTVLESGNATDALAILDKRSDVALLFTDVVMPDINGKKLADEAQRRNPALRVLFTTGYTRNAVVHGGVLDADVQLLSKPFTLDQLAAKIRAALDRQERKASS